MFRSLYGQIDKFKSLFVIAPISSRKSAEPSQGEEELAEAAVVSETRKTKKKKKTEMSLWSFTKSRQTKQLARFFTISRSFSQLRSQPETWVLNTKTHSLSQMHILELRLSLSVLWFSLSSPSFGIAFDIDGVIIRGEAPVGNSPQAIRRLYHDSGACIYNALVHLFLEVGNIRLGIVLSS